jgi:hypothetical protein
MFCYSLPADVVHALLWTSLLLSDLSNVPFRCSVAVCTWLSIIVALFSFALSSHCYLQPEILSFFLLFAMHILRRRARVRSHQQRISGQQAQLLACLPAV